MSLVVPFVMWYFGKASFKNKVVKYRANPADSKRKNKALYVET